MKNSRLEVLRQRMPQIPGILGRDEYHSSAILVPLIYLEGEEHFLFEKRAPYIRQGSEVCFPGGHVDHSNDSDGLETALREVEEELGLAREMVDVIGQLDTLVSPRGIIVECFLGVLKLEDVGSLTLDSEEVDEVFTVPVSWFYHNPPEVYRTRVEIQSSYVDGDGKKHILLPVEELGLPRHYKDNRSEWMKRVVVYRRKPDIIWGLTAAIVENVVTTALPQNSEPERMV
ncbi:NUDIX hydrolase [Desulfopila inferna]|uniref:NUDIX hydrolase n=1 Tax=Desulfopila inferna TaxID=468528 RepID=UPI001962F891|nr:CoA pyrophosphatase [Desulfopila inferna]MBM9603507.1 CoA pyrophosphatase [Desulfopila inferna]